MNFLALLGWSLDDKTEMFTREDLIKYFSIERVSKTPAIFNKEKLTWLNGIYIRKMGPDEFAKRALPFLERDLPASVKRPLAFEYVCKVTPLIQERVKLLKEVGALSHYFFTDELSYDIKLVIGKDMNAESTSRVLSLSRERLAGLASFHAETLESTLRPLASELGVKTGQLFGALRTAVSGETATPPLFQMMEVIGNERCMKRIDSAIASLKGVA